MAPGRSCADRPWIGVPTAFHSSTEQWPTVLELQAVLVPLERSLNVPPRG